MNVTALVNSIKCWTANFCIHTNNGPVIIMNQLKSVCNMQFKHKYSHPIYTSYLIIAGNELISTLSDQEKMARPINILIFNLLSKCKRRYN